MNKILAGYNNLGCRLFSFITLSMSYHSLLAWGVSIERSAVILIRIPLCVICCFSLAAFNICSLCLIFISLINMCLGCFDTQWWQRIRWLDGITDSMDMSLSWWWTGKPGVLQSMGSQRVGHDWATKLNWSAVFCLGFILLGTLWVSWTWVAISFPILGKFSTVNSSSIF